MTARTLSRVPGWLPIFEAAARLGVSVAWVRRHAKAEGVEVSCGCLPTATVEAWAEAGRISAGEICAPPRRAARASD